MNLAILLFQLFVFLFSIIIHEVSHGLMALRLGDTTAKDAGRLTLNPWPHLELFGSFILPFMLYFASGGTFVFGWAKPVPYNPYNLKNPKLGGGLIAAAGPISNLTIAFLFGLIVRFGMPLLGVVGNETTVILFHLIIIVNILLAIFNLVPIPPLDGSKILFALLPKQAEGSRIFLERYGLFLLLFFIFFGFRFIQPIIFGLYKLFAGAAVL